MKVKYLDLIEQTFDFPTMNSKLLIILMQIPLMDIITIWNTVEISYLPRSVNRSRKQMVQCCNG
jgi:hypothetical protein